MAYTEVNLGAIKAAETEQERDGDGEGEGEGQYEDPDKLARSGRRFRGRYAPGQAPAAQAQHSPSPYELPVDTAERTSAADSTSSSTGVPATDGAACTYATADELGRSWKDTKIPDTAAYY